ncbi:unnamed protein product [Paramecium sonneborni]|uniref:Uncharacterized protein n=1 Tax=Paramecium sonneborni TaxID=65129 RepID=A0A8S1NMG3_9CILI|nr:unnamed protein product [Paramecium sonneborni]
MSFIQQFVSQQVPEWKSAYLNYQLLKEVLDPFKRVTNSLPILNLTIKLIKDQNLDANIPQEIQTKLQILEEEFIQLFQDETQKCNNFFLIQVKILKHQYEKMIDFEDDFERIKAFETLYKKGQLLKQFKNSNIEATHRILQSYHRYTSFIDNSENHMDNFFKNLEFVNDTSLNKIIKNIKANYIRNGWNGQELEKLKQQYAIQHKLQYIGFLGGIIIYLMLSFIYQRIDLNFLNISEDYTTYLLFITMAIPLFYLWFFSTLLQILKKKYINYWVIFKIDYIRDSISKLYYLAAIITIIFLSIVNYGLISEFQFYALTNKLIYYQMFSFIEFDPVYALFIFWIFLVLFMINPLKVFGYEARKYFWILQIKTLSGLYLSKEILWNIEQMISCSQFFRLFSYTIYYYICYFKHQNQFQEFNYYTQSVLTIPFIYGFYYSIKVYIKDKNSYLNLIKFTTMLTLIIISQINIFIKYLPNQLLYCLIIICGLCVSFIDVKYDWGLLNQQSQNCLLRQILGYHKNFYYFSMFFNVIGRIFLFIQLCNIIQNKNILLIYSIVESIRLFLWNLITIEKEHVINIGEFKAVADVVIEGDDRFMNELKEFFLRLQNQNILKGSFRKKACSLNLMIKKLEQNIEQNQI